MTIADSMRELMSAKCVCGAAKAPRRSFCLPCYRRLSRSLRQRLSGVWSRETQRPDYPTTYAAALAHLTQ